MSRQNSNYRRHSIAAKLLLIERYESGVTVRMLSEETGIYPTQIKEWIRQYNSNGVAGLSLKNPAYPASLKVEVALKVISKELSLHQASLNYRITRAVIQKWIKKVQNQGIESLSADGRGRPPKKDMNKKARKTPKPLSREQELLIENERLRAENAYLKKLRALVEERVARESGKSPKSSRD